MMYKVPYVSLSKIYVFYVFRSNFFEIFESLSLSLKFGLEVGLKSDFLSKIYEIENLYSLSLSLFKSLFEEEEETKKQKIQI